MLEALGSEMTDEEIEESGFPAPHDKVAYEPAGFMPDPHDTGAVAPVSSKDLELADERPDFARMPPEVLRGIDIYLLGAPYKEASKAAGISSQTLSKYVNSPLGQAYIATYYNQRKSWMNALYTRAVMVQAEAMQSPMEPTRLRASEVLLKHFGIRQSEGEKAPTNATEVASAVVREFMKGLKDANIKVQMPQPEAIDITPAKE